VVAGSEEEEAAEEAEARLEPADSLVEAGSVVVRALLASAAEAAAGLTPEPRAGLSRSPGRQSE
jgi:hypothetical protein